MPPVITREDGGPLGNAPSVQHRLSRSPIPLAPNKPSTVVPVLAIMVYTRIPAREARAFRAMMLEVGDIPENVQCAMGMP